MKHTTVLPPGWWETPAPPAMRLLHLLLLALADRDGITRLDTAALAPDMGLERREVYQLLQALQGSGQLLMYEGAGSWWGWLPHAADYVPTRGKLKRARRPELPAPPREAVVGQLEQLWQRTVTTQEAKAACPRAWGRTGASSGNTAPPEAQVVQVWEEWRARQARPEACRLGVGARGEITRALGEATVEQLVLLVRFAYTADEPGPRFWRGANDRRMTYLGLDNLFVAKKLGQRIQAALAWADQQQQHRATEDGTDLGPMAAYRRRGPDGTTTSPDPRPARLSQQCRTMLTLFVERGSAGVRTSELAEIALKYTGRISELRGMGCDVYVAERATRSGDNLYVMRNAADYTEDS